MSDRTRIHRGAMRSWYRDPDKVTRQFIRIICSDPELDFCVSRLVGLFGVDEPETQGGWAHHVRQSA